MNVELERSPSPEALSFSDQLGFRGARVLRYRLYFTLLIIDIMCLNFGLAGGYALRFSGQLEQSFVNVLFTLIPIYLVFAVNFSAYSVDSLREADRAAGRGVGAIFMAFVILFLLGFFLRVEQDVSRLALLMGIAISSVMLFVARYVFVQTIARSHSSRLSRLALIVDMDRDPPPPRGKGYDRIDAIAEGLVADRRDPMMLDRLAIRLSAYDRVIVACQPEKRREWAVILKGANIRGEIVVPEFEALGALTLSQFGGDRTLVVGAGPLALRDRLTKRCFDLAVALPAVLILLPVLLIVALAIKFDSTGPVFFRQQRVGRGNRLFSVLKFRSMRADMTDGDGARSASRDDDRITRIGAFLRRTSLDELPQLLNVIGGSMSIVGPRPHALGSRAGEDHFWDVEEHYWHRHLLRPGITGLAQVRGFRGATLERADLTRRLQADLEYISGWSLWRDIAILFRTINVVTHKNAY
ncbi:MAG: sugar transferase [Pacificimonas sp.]